MNNIKITIFFNDGSEEVLYCCDFTVKDGVLKVAIRYQNTLCYPLVSIKKYIVD